MNEARLKNARILVVDDEIGSNCLLVNLLARFGYNLVKTISDPSEVFDAVDQFSPDIILLDLFMQQLSGFQVMQRLRETLSPDTAPPILVITGDWSRETKRKALANGATDILGKPFDPSEMLMRIRNLLHARFLHLELHEQNRILEEQVCERTRDLVDALADLRDSQRQAIQHERLRAFGAMASGVVHDFNNALMSVIGYSDLLIDDPAMIDDRPLVMDYLQIMNAAGREASHVVSRLRDFYRPRDEGDVIWPADINKLISEIVETTKPRWKDQALGEGRTILVDLDLERVPQIRCNERELRDVATNLIFNAVDAMPNGGSITIRTRRDGDVILWETSDSGVGMDEATRARCFEPFFSTKGEEGTGLGLSIVFGAVMRHDGEMEIESEQGRGSTFRIRLPIATAIPADFDDAPPPGKALRILVADDDRVGRNVIAEYLRLDGHSVATASNGVEALDLFKAKEFDLLVTDFGMPGMSGTQLARAIRRIKPDCPAILLTGFTEAPDILEKSQDFDKVLSKPILRNSLRRAVSEIVPGEPSENLLSAQAV